MRNRYDEDPAFEVFKWAIAVIACCVAVFALIGLGAVVGRILGVGG